MSYKQYKCSQCGFKKEIDTNHYGECYSVGHYNTCDACPPYKKYPEFEGRTVWQFNGVLPEGAWVPEPFKEVRVKVSKQKGK